MNKDQPDATHLEQEQLDVEHAIFVQQVGIDLIGPLPTTLNGNKYVVTLVDYFKISLLME